MSNLRIADKVFPSIDYNGGKVWVDKYDNIIPSEAWFYNDQSKVAFQNYLNNSYSVVMGLEYKIIAQTPDLNLDVPVVEVDIYTASEQKGIPNHCHMAQVFKNGKAFVNIEPTMPSEDATDTAKRIADLLNSKGTYTEEQVLKAIELSRRPFGYRNYTQLTPQEILASIQPEIVVEMYWESFNANPAILVPRTEQRNGRTYFKIKQ